MSDLIGQSLGRYHILEQLGQGGMAIVYKAYDIRLERDVAIKIIRKGAFPPDHVERILKRFEREAKALARLSHSNIVKVYDYGDHEGAPYLVMEYLPSGTLKQKLGKAILWQEAVRLLMPIAEALDYAHSQNMIHRDVKPSNILLTQRGQPMLTDFGIAKILDLEETQDLTGTSAAVGTPEYMAPEQATAKTVDHRADIYALGVVLYEMVTGRKPYTADTPLAVLFKHVGEPLPRPKQFAPNLPDGVEKILIKALSKNPEDRYQSMAAMGIAFEKTIGGQVKSSVARKKAEEEAIEKAERDAAEKVKQEIADKLKTGEPKPIEEKLARKTSQVETIANGSQTAQRNLGKQVAFWVIGFAVVLVIGMLALNNRSNSLTFAGTATGTLLPEVDTAVPADTIPPTKTPTQVVIPTASAVPRTNTPRVFVTATSTQTSTTTSTSAPIFMQKTKDGLKFTFRVQNIPNECDQVTCELRWIVWEGSWINGDPRYGAENFSTLRYDSGWKKADDQALTFVISIPNSLPGKPYHITFKICTDSSRSQCQTTSGQYSRW